MSQGHGPNVTLIVTLNIGNCGPGRQETLVPQQVITVASEVQKCETIAASVPKLTQVHGYEALTQCIVVLVPL